MKKPLVYLTVIITALVVIGWLLSFVKPDLILGFLKILSPLADSLHPSRWFSGSQMDFYEYLKDGYVLNRFNIRENQTVYRIVSIIGAILVIAGGAFVLSRDTFAEKVTCLMVIATFFSAVFGLEFVLAVIIIGIVVSFAG